MKKGADEKIDEISSVGLGILKCLPYGPCLYSVIFCKMTVPIKALYKVGLFFFISYKD